MRVYDNLNLAIEEIRRDLAKSPVITSKRVQATKIEAKNYEALNYSYSIPASEMPDDHHDLAKLGAKYFESWKDITQMVGWLSIEYSNRFNPLSASARTVNGEDFHPALKSQLEGSHYAYTYRERMIGMLASMESVLFKDPGSRRAYWPIYQPLDGIRASDMTRIPCTLGYSFIIRDVPLIGPQLHVTNLQRSCDFETFFLSDLWFTHCAQKKLAERLEVECGLINHTILSFHYFTDAEIY